MKAIFGSNTALRKREIDGVITDGEGMVFKKDILDAWFNKPRIAPPQTINHNRIYVALDPNAGANKSNTPGSNTAIVSFFVTNGCFVVSLFIMCRRVGFVPNTPVCDRQPTAANSIAALYRPLRLLLLGAGLP